MGKRHPISLLSRLRKASHAGTGTSVRPHEIHDVLRAVEFYRDCEAAIRKQVQAPGGFSIGYGKLVYAEAEPEPARLVEQAEIPREDWPTLATASRLAWQMGAAVVIDPERLADHNRRRASRFCTCPSDVGERRDGTCIVCGGRWDSRDQAASPSYPAGSIPAGAGGLLGLDRGAPARWPFTAATDQDEQNGSGDGPA